MELTPAAASLTTACPAPGVGSGTSSRVRASGPPGVWMRIAFMVASYFQECSDFVHHVLPPRLDLLGPEGFPRLEHPGLDLFRQLLRPLEQSRDLVEVLVEEREDGDGAEGALVEILVHEIRVLVAQKRAQLDVRIALDQLEEHGDVVERVPAPVFGDDHDLELLAHLGEGGFVLRLDLDLGEELHECLFVRAHLVQVLRDGDALPESLLRQHRLSLCAAAYRIAARSTVNFATSFSSASLTTSTTRPFGSIPSAGKAYRHCAAYRPSLSRSAVRSFCTKLALTVWEPASIS